MGRRRKKFKRPKRERKPPPPPYTSEEVVAHLKTLWSGVEVWLEDDGTTKGKIGICRFGRVVYTKDPETAELLIKSAEAFRLVLPKA